MFKTQKQQVSYLTLKQRITAGVMAFFMLGQICFPAVAAAAYLTGDETITQALSSNFFERASTSSYLYQKSDLAYSGNLSNQNIASFHKRLVDNKISLPAPTYIPIAGDITIIVPHQPVGKLVGDVYVQNRLVRQQVFNQLGRHLIDPENNDSEFVQINKLYNNAYVYAQRTGKIYGTKLSASDVAYLNSQGLDVLWPEHRLIDGATVVVPILYLTENTVATQSVNDHVIEFFGEHNQLGSVTISNQSLRLGRDSFLAVRDVKLVNGTIKSEGNIAIQATGNISALGSVIDAKSSLNLHVGGVFSLIDGSQVVANNNVDIYAGQVHLKTLVHLFTDRYGQGTRLSEISAITANGNITVNSSQDITLEASKITSSNGAITLSAGTNINILPVVTQYSSEYKVGDWEVSQNSLNAIGSSITANDTIKLIAGGAINITASELISTQGGIELLAEQGIHILDSLDQTQIQKVDRKGKTKGQASEFRTEAVRSVLAAGKAVLLDTEFGDVTLKATNINTLDGTGINARNGKVHLLMTKELEEFHLQTVRKGTWTIKTRTEDIIHENNIQNAIVGGLQVQAKYGINVEYTGKEGATLKDQIDEYRKIPEMNWMADLYDQAIAAGGGDVDWQMMEEIHQELKKTKRNLSPAAMAIIAIVVSVVTMGAGAALVGAAQGTTYAAISNAALTTLATQATQSLAAGNSPGDTLKTMGSSDSLRSLATSMATAGVLQNTNVGMFSEAAASENLLVSLSGQAAQSVVNATVTAGVSLAINGGNSEDFKDAFIQSVAMDAINSIGERVATKIGVLAKLPEGEGIGAAAKYISHAALGCMTGALTSELNDTDGKLGCASGAGGAVIGEYVGSVYADRIDQELRDWIDESVRESGERPTLQQQQEKFAYFKSQGVDMARLSAAIAAFATGGDVNIAADSGQNAAQNNALALFQSLYAYLKLNGDGDWYKGLAAFGEREDFLTKMTDAITAEVNEYGQEMYSLVAEGHEQEIELLASLITKMYEDSLVGKSEAAAAQLMTAGIEVVIETAPGQYIKKRWSDLDSVDQSAIKGAGRIAEIIMDAPARGRVSAVKRMIEMPEVGSGQMNIAEMVGDANHPDWAKVDLDVREHITEPKLLLTGPARVTLNRDNGRKFQDSVTAALYGKENHTPIEVELSNGVKVTTVPDLFDERFGVTDIKDELYLTRSRQLRAQVQLAIDSGTTFNLIISPRTQSISKPLLTDIYRSGGSIFEFDPKTGSFSDIEVVNGERFKR
jgi:hypothetical protein